MAVNSEFPEFNGVAPSWADVQCLFAFDGLPLLTMADFKSIDTGSSLDVGEQRGATGGRVKKRTSGLAKYTAKATLYADGYQLFLRRIIAKAKAIGAVRGNQVVMRYVHFNITIKQTPFGTTEIFERRVKGCFFAGRDSNFSEGNDASEVDVTLNPIEIADVVDGVEAVLL